MDPFVALSAFIAGREAIPHVWGANDCVSFCADAGVAMGFGDLLAGLRGYRTERGALLKLRKAGYADVLALACDRLSETPVGMARSGDIGYVPNDTPFGGGLAMVSGALLFGVSPTGLDIADRAVMARAFRLR